MPETRELEMRAFVRTNRTNLAMFGFSSELAKLCDETELKSLAFVSRYTTHDKIRQVKVRKQRRRKGGSTRQLNTHISRTLFFMCSLLARPYPSTPTAPPVRAARRSATTTSRAGAGRLGSGDRMEATALSRRGWWGSGLTSGGSDRAWIVRCVGIFLGGPGYCTYNAMVPFFHVLLKIV